MMDKVGKILVGLGLLVAGYGVVATLYPGPVVYESAFLGGSDASSAAESRGTLAASDCFEIEETGELLVRTKYVRDVTRVKRNARNSYSMTIADPREEVAVETNFKHRVKGKPKKKDKTFLKYIFGGDEKAVTVARLDADRVGKWCYRLKREDREFEEASVSLEIRKAVLPHGFLSIVAGLGVVFGGGLLGRMGRRTG